MDDVNDNKAETDSTAAETHSQTNTNTTSSSIPHPFSHTGGSPPAGAPPRTLAAANHHRAPVVGIGGLSASSQHSDSASQNSGHHHTGGGDHGGSRSGEAGQRGGAGDEGSGGGDVATAQRSLRHFFDQTMLYEFVPENTRMLVLDTRIPMHVAIRALLDYKKSFASLWHVEDRSFVGLLTSWELIDFFRGYYAALQACQASLPSPLPPSSPSPAPSDHPSPTAAAATSSREQWLHVVQQADSTGEDGGGGASPVGSDALAKKASDWGAMLASVVDGLYRDRVRPSLAAIRQRLQDSPEHSVLAGLASSQLRAYFASEADTYEVHRDEAVTLRHPPDDFEGFLDGGSPPPSSSDPPDASFPLTPPNPPTDAPLPPADNGHTSDPLTTVRDGSSPSIKGGSMPPSTPTPSDPSSHPPSHAASPGGGPGSASDGPWGRASAGGSGTGGAAASAPSGEVAAWDVSIEKWRELARMPRCFPAVTTQRTLLDALRLLLDTQSPHVAVWNDDRGSPLSFISLIHILTHLVQNLRGTFDIFNMPVRAALKVGTYTDIVTLRRSTPLIEVLGKMLERRISVMPLTDDAGAYKGCFSRQHFVQLVWRGFSDPTFQIDMQSSVDAALESLTTAPSPPAAPSPTAVPQVSPAPASIQAAGGTLAAPPMHMHRQLSESNAPAGPGASGGSVAATPSPAGSMAFSGAVPGGLSQQCEVYESDILLRDASAHVLFCEHRRVFLCDPNDNTLRGVITASDICKFLIGWSGVGGRTAADGNDPSSASPDVSRWDAQSDGHDPHPNDPSHGGGGDERPNESWG
ncbi:unnamed protein product [Vitrella brassicaformis CCMP3155]|uniref:CBS domain-containing protein n=2 Tax=Vitrella brassicaformis TaxID=1169539 RepID=A0A0G4EEM7_VITBC|nr:unnamed protein product [Vitrella brassicaformis CCMP3155]|eukprot:CEL93827.1 unnamed protein product [Vitrella brassicaformis CCMP3155]